MRFLLALVFVGLSGCVSIATHEQAMKKCRDQEEALSQLRVHATDLETKNTDLNKALYDSQTEHARLQGEMSDVRNTYDELVKQLKDNIANGEISVRQTDKGLTVAMGNEILFASGQAELQQRGKKVLMQVASIINKQTDRLVQVEGHTDNIRIAGGLKKKFPSNWDLSSARAASVVRFLQEKGLIDSSRLILMAFAENHPIADNNTPEGRQQNRRVEITLISQP